MSDETPGNVLMRLIAWPRRHPVALVLAVLLLAGAIGWGTYRASWYYPARAHFRAAEQALERAEWAEARNRAKAGLALWPDHADGHLFAARAARRLHKVKEANEHLDAAGRLFGGETQAIEIERALLRLRSGDLTGVEQFLNDCIAQGDPATVEILDGLATAYLDEQRVLEAHRCLDELVRRQPNNFDKLVLHGQTAENLARNTVAGESYRKAVELRPDAHVVRLSLAQALVASGRYPEALEHLRRLRQREPNNPAVTFALAGCLALNGQRDKAAELLDGLLAQEPDNWTVLAERGWLYLELDRPAEAEPLLRKANALAPPNQTLLTRLADCLRLLGKHEEARQHRDEAERLRAESLRVTDLTRRIREERLNDPDVFHELGAIHVRQRQDQMALHYFKKALEAKPNHRVTHESLAAYYTRVGATSQAAYHRQQVGRGP